MLKYYFLTFFLLISVTALAQSDKGMRALAITSYDATLSHYPDLERAKINIKITQRGSAMAASYAWWSVFVKPKHRKYFVKINQNVQGAYMCYQFDHLTGKSRDGVMGHELAHIDFFHDLNFFGFMKFIINQGLPGGLKKSETATDIRTIEHGLGEELKAWSEETREGYLQSAGQKIPKKFGDRYLHPMEIDSVMESLPESKD